MLLSFFYIALRFAKRPVLQKGKDHTKNIISPAPPKKAGEKHTHTHTQQKAINSTKNIHKHKQKTRIKTIKNKQQQTNKT